VNIQILNPLEVPNWDNMLLASDRATFFHTTAWARVLSESYAYKPLYFSVVDNGHLAGLIPVMEIDSFLTGKRGVSLPFTDICHPIAETQETFNALMDSLTQRGRSSGWKYIDLKGGGHFFKNGAEPCAEHFIHMLHLDGGEDRIQRALRDSTRRNIRKAERAGVQVSFQNTLDAVAAFYRLHCLTRKRHGSPPQPWHFFQKVYEHIIATGKGTLIAAAHGGRVVAGAVYFFFQKRALFKFGASDQTFQHLRANNLVMWEAIRLFIRSGIQSLHFGRTEPSGKSLLQYKRGWGAEENKIAYYRLPLSENAFHIRNGHLPFASVFRILPMPLLKLAGSTLYRHVG
jgi:hypothetical protein